MASYSPDYDDTLPLLSDSGCEEDEVVFGQDFNYNDAVNQLDDLLTIIYRCRKINNCLQIEKEHRIIEELGNLFAIRHFWHFSKMLTSLSFSIGLYTFFETDEKAIEKFCKHAEMSSGLRKQILTIFLSGDCDERDEEGLNHIIRTIIRDFDLFNYGEQEALSVILRELGIYFRMKQHWCYSQILHEIDSQLGVYTTDIYNYELVDMFKEVCKETQLKKCINLWIERFV